MSAREEIARFGRELMGRSASDGQEIQRFNDGSFQAYVDSFLAYQGQIYQPNYTTTAMGQKVEPVADTFQGYVQGAYKTNGIVFAVSMARARPFSEISFAFRRKGQPGGGNDLFGNRSLDILDVPWPGGTTQDLLLRAEQDVTAAGTFFVAREESPFGDRPDRLRRLRPDWCEFILTAPPDQAVASDIAGIKYTAGGTQSGGPYYLYTLDEVAFWAPIPDPSASFRGMSWLSPVIEEMQGDKAATTHKLKFFENAATPNLSVSLKESVGPERFMQFVRQMNEASVGVDQAYKTLYVGGGADVRVIGADMKQLDFRATQGAGETRVAAAGGVPPIIVGLSEGLAAATYSNYGQAKRAYADLFLRSQWRSLCGALAPIIEVPDDANLWYDARDVAFLREDSKDLAEIQSVQMGTMGAGIAAGYEPDSVTAAVQAEDWSLLKHTGMVSVQLQPPGAEDPNVPGAPDGGGPPSSVARSIRYSRGMTDVTRHLPGQHNQGSHGNRVGNIRVAGKTGLGLKHRVGTHQIRYGDAVTVSQDDGSHNIGRHPRIGGTGRVTGMEEGGTHADVQFPDGKTERFSTTNLTVHQTVDELDASDRKAEDTRLAEQRKSTAALRKERAAPASAPTSTSLRMNEVVNIIRKDGSAHLSLKGETVTVGFQGSGMPGELIMVGGGYYVVKTKDGRRFDIGKGELVQVQK